MLLKDLLQLLHTISLEAGTSMPLLVGGAVRDKVLGKLQQSFSDIDITNGDKTISHLAKEFSIKLNHIIPAVTKQAQDGHISVFIKNLKIDFSSNFNVPGIENILIKQGISNPTDMQKEIYSRDFFCNTLLMSLDFRKIKDLTNQGIKDIGDKKIKTCLSPDLTFKFNTNRIIRSIYLSAKLDFDVDPSIIEWVRQNPRYLSNSERVYLSKNIDKALTYNPDRTIYLINKMNIWNYIPITTLLEPYFRNQTFKEMVNVPK